MLPDSNGAVVAAIQILRLAVKKKCAAMRTGIRKCSAIKHSNRLATECGPNINVLAVVTAHIIAFD